MDDLHRRFEKHLQQNMRLEREAYERSEQYRRILNSDTHDEWRTLNQTPEK